MRCTEHPDAEASFSCARCDAWRCDACIKRVAAGTMTGKPMLVCPACDGLLVEAERSVPAPKTELADLVRRPTSPDGLLMILALAVPCWIASAPFPGLSHLAAAVFVGCLAAFYFQTVDHVGRGRPGLPFSPSVLSRADLVNSLFRGLACAVVALGPLLLWSTFAQGGKLGAALCFLCGLALTPAAILTIVLTGRGINALSPVAWAMVIARAPSSYAALAGVFVTSSAVWAAAVWLTARTLGRIPFVGSLFIGVAMSFFAIVQAAIIGSYLRRNAEHFGYD